MIKPIPTYYKGILFRSRLEARWAVFFDNINLEWIYESEGYETDSGNYLPDFEIPSYECFIEVKPTIELAITKRNVERYKSFSEGLHTDLILCINSPNVHSTFVFSEWNPEYTHTIIPFVDMVKSKYGRYWSSGTPPGSNKDQFHLCDPFHDAIITARNYKFSESKIW